MKKGAKFLQVPTNEDVPEDKCDRPLAFVAKDFQFFTADLTLVPHHQLLATHKLGGIQFVQLQWHYDKSARNFVFKRYSLSPDSIFNPVLLPLMLSIGLVFCMCH